MEEIVSKSYKQFDQKRKLFESAQTDIREIEELESRLKKKK